MLELRRDGQTVGFRESEREGRVTSADEENGLITTSVTGTSPQGETDTLAVCRILVQKMNQLGDTWNDPVAWREDDSDIDCASTDANDERTPLHIQVVRAFVDERFWRGLGVSKTATTSGAADELAGVILQAVEKKQGHTPPKRRSHLVLAIDANRLPGLTLDSVVKRVCEKHGVTLESMGFRSVWLVGPSVSRTHRLDIKA